MKQKQLLSYAKNILTELGEYSVELAGYLQTRASFSIKYINSSKARFVNLLYKQRGRHAKRLMHSGMAGIAAFGVMIAPIVAQEFPSSGVDPWEAPSPASVLSVSDEGGIQTLFADKQFRDSIIEYTVEEGDTVSTIANKFDISEDTLRWANDIGARDTIKIGQVLEVLPVTGVSHTVKKGDTVYSIAKKYDTEAQNIVNYPFNIYRNDETFELAIGQTIMVPDGVVPNAVQTSPRLRQTTPDAGAVFATGQFMWPTQGRLTQYWVWYHPAIDIANRAAPSVVAADSGTVAVAGWLDNYGYGNRVIINHGNGTQTLYAHLSRIYVVPGQTVNRGDAIGQMGNTGRSTGTHLHFEVIRNGVKVNPLSVL